MALDFSLTAEQHLARESIRGLLSRVSPPDYVRDCDLGHKPPREAFEAVAAAGWLGLGIAEHYGGNGGGPIELALLLEEVGRVHLDLALWLFRNLSHGGAGISRHGTEAQRQRYLPAIARGELSLAFALTEPEAGSDATSITTRAERDGAGFVITGQKWFTSGMSVADLVLVVARTTVSDDKRHGMTSFLVDVDAPGVTATPVDTLGTWSLGTSAVYFDHVRVSQEAVLGTVDHGWPELREILEYERLCLSAARLGAAESALHEAVEYSKTRRQFGRPIGAFQAVSHKLADLAVAVDASRLLVQRLAWLMATNQPRTREAAMTKLHVAETYQRVAEGALQVLGGAGYAMESAIARHYRDAKLGTIGGGTSEIQRDVIARSLGLRSS